VLAVALTLALWLAGTLGVMHRAAHAPEHAPRSAGAQALNTAQGSHVAHAPRAVPNGKAAPAALPVARPGGWVGALFGLHDEAQCQLYDQLAHGAAAPCVPVLVLPLLLPVATLHFLEGQALARWVALFDARGPPATR